MIRWTSTLAPMSMPRVGSSRIRTLRLRGEPLGQDDLLLVAARTGPRPAGRRRSSGRRTARCSRRRPCARSTARIRKPREQPRQDRQRHVLGDREVEDEALLVAVLGQVGDARRPSPRTGSRSDTAVPPSADLAGIALVDPEQDARHLGPAGPDQAGQADDLAGADRERDVVGTHRPASAPRPRAGRRRSASRPSGRATPSARPCGGRGRRS